MDLIPPQYKWMVDVALVAALAGSCGYGGWHLRGLKATAVEANMKTEAAAAQTQAVEQAYATQKQRDDAAHAEALRLAAIDKEELTRLKEAQDETNRIRQRVDDGTLGLRIGAKCPVRPPAGNLPAAPASPSVGTRATAELDESARRAYFALRDGIDKVTGQLKACQQAIRTYTGQ